MARPFQAGFEAGEDAFANANSQGQMFGSKVARPSTGAARVYTTAVNAWSTAPAGALRSGYVQFRVRVERLPSDGNGKVVIYQTLNGVSNPSGTPAILLNSSGQLEFLSYSGTTTATTIVTSAALTLGRWYLVQFFCQMNSATQTGAAGVETNGRLDVWLDQVQLVAYAPTSVTAADGLHTTGGSFSTTKLGNTVEPPFASATNAIVCFDDFVLDTVALPANEHIVALRPNGLGTYSAWTNAIRGLAANLTTATGVTSSTALQRVSYTVPTLRSLGITGNTVGNARLYVNGGATGPATLFLIINGVETSVAVNFAGALSAIASRVTDFAVTLAPDDVVQIGYEKDNSVTPRNFSFLYLAVSVPDARVSLPALSEDVDFRFLQYTGDGTASKTVALPFEPDFILVVPAGGTSQTIPQWWDSSSRQCLELTNSTTLTAHDLLVRQGFAEMVVTNALGAAALNTNAAVYDVFVVRDPSRRLVERGDFTRPGSEDNFNVALETPTFPPRFLMAHSQSGSSGGTACVHGTSAVADLAYPVGQTVGGVANLIQSVGAGTFQIGSNNTLIINSIFNPYVAFQDQSYHLVPLMEVVAWTGTGTNPRVLPLTNTTNVVKLVLVIPIAAGTSVDGRRAHIRTPGFTGSNSRHLSGTAGMVTTGITALGTGAFTVGADCNLSGQTYQALVMFQGLDPGVVAVPDVFGLTLAAATAALAAVGLIVGTVINVGTVVEQTPIAGTVVVVGSSVNLTFDAPPVLVNPGDQESTELVPDTLQLVATSINPHTLVYTVTGLPPGLSVNPNTGLISGTPAVGTRGTYTVTATVEGKDPTGNVMPVTMPFTL